MYDLDIMCKNDIPATVTGVTLDMTVLVLNLVRANITNILNYSVYLGV